MRADGRMVMRPESARAALFHDCPRDRANTAITLLRPQTPATSTQPATAAAWRDIPSTYIRCTQDRLPYELVSPAYWKHASRVLTLPAGHCPQLPPAPADTRPPEINLAEYRIHRKQVLGGLTHEYQIAA